MSVKNSVEKATGVIWGTYRWREDPPKVFLAIGTPNKTKIEAGLFGHQFYATWGVMPTVGERVDNAMARVALR